MKTKKIPYGIASYEKIKENNAFYFVDKTKYIETIEDLGSQFHFFLRPRRFGKSLFLSILEHYYDLNKKDQFEELFGDTYIGKNPTPLKNSFPILKLNFSGLATDKGIEQTEQSFNLAIYEGIEDFLSKYDYLSEKLKNVSSSILQIDNATDMLRHCMHHLNILNIKYILLIDEYDNFANNVLIHHGKERYKEITHKSGFLRSFFAAIKNATETRTIERMFVTGVSPLVLSDVTSGMNIGDNISNQSLFNAMVGFTQLEVEIMLDYYISEKVVKEEERDEILAIMKKNYNNYCFSSNTDERVYNSDMVLYFFNKYSQEKRIPNNLIDENVRIDYGKLKFLILESKKLNGNFSILSELAEHQEIATNLVHSFALDDIVEKDKFRSFLYYLGLVTIKKNIFASRYVLNIPNEVIKTMHFDYIRRSFKDSFDLNIDVDFLSSEFPKTAFDGKWEVLFRHILDKFYAAVSLRDFVFREHSIKMFMLAYLNVTPLYFIESEKEMNKGYADIFLKKNYFTTDLTNYEYIVELKYIKSDEIKNKSGKVTKIVLQRYRKEAIEQLEKYAKNQEITCKLKKIIIICSSQKLLLLEEMKGND